MTILIEDNETYITVFEPISNRMVRSFTLSDFVSFLDIKKNELIARNYRNLKFLPGEDQCLIKYDRPESHSERQIRENDAKKIELAEYKEYLRLKEKYGDRDANNTDI